jgi:hypothetical protein
VVGGWFLRSPGALGSDDDPFFGQEILSPFRHDDPLPCLSARRPYPGVPEDSLAFDRGESSFIPVAAALEPLQGTTQLLSANYFGATLL